MQSQGIPYGEASPNQLLDEKSPSQRNRKRKDIESLPCDHPATTQTLDLLPHLQRQAKREDRAVTHSTQDIPIDLETQCSEIFPPEDRQHIISVTNQIRNQLSSRQRPVEVGCVIKIPLSDFIRDDSNCTNESTHIYGVVRKYHSYCSLTTARAYLVVFCLRNVTIPPSTIPLLHVPIYENEMDVVRYPDQNASLDDPNLDLLFHKVNGNWIARSLFSN